jgi:hypothetical protein
MRRLVAHLMKLTQPINGTIDAQLLHFTSQEFASTVL